MSKDGQILNLKARFIREVGAIELAQCEELINVRSLNLAQNDIGDKGVKAIAESTILANLRSLNLKSNSIGDEGARILAESTTLVNLRSIQLVVNNITDEGERVLMNSTSLVSLSSLFLAHPSGGEGAFWARRSYRFNSPDLSSFKSLGGWLGFIQIKFYKSNGFFIWHIKTV